MRFSGHIDGIREFEIAFPQRACCASPSAVPRGDHPRIRLLATRLDLIATSPPV